MREILLEPLTVEYGGMKGLQTAIEKSADVIGDHEASVERGQLLALFDDLRTTPDS